MIAWESQAYTLLAGTAGTTYTLASNPFRVCDDEEELDAQPANAIERLCEVAFEGPEEFESFSNGPMNNRRLAKYKLTIRVGYEYTASGLDFDATGQQSGAGSKRAIRQRARADENQILTVFMWWQNWTVFSPAAFLVKQSVPPSIEWRLDRAIMTLTLDFCANLRMPGTYGPSLTGS